MNFSTWNFRLLFKLLSEGWNSNYFWNAKKIDFWLSEGIRCTGLLAVSRCLSDKSMLNVVSLFSVKNKCTDRCYRFVSELEKPCSKWLAVVVRRETFRRSVLLAKFEYGRTSTVEDALIWKSNLGGKRENNLGSRPEHRRLNVGSIRSTYLAKPLIGRLLEDKKLFHFAVLFPAKSSSWEVSAEVQPKPNTQPLELFRIDSQINNS